MNTKELSEIRRRFKVERTNISRIRGALINEKKEVISRFDQSLNIISEEEAEAILKILKKALSGALNKQLIDISFTNQQVLEGSEHKMLSALKASSLSDDKALEELIESVRLSYKAKGNYLIILGSDAYDVPSYGSDGKKEDSGEIYSYIDLIVKKTGIVNVGSGCIYNVLAPYVTARVEFKLGRDSAYKTALKAAYVGICVYGFNVRFYIVIESVKEAEVSAADNEALRLLIAFSVIGAIVKSRKLLYSVTVFVNEISGIVEVYSVSRRNGRVFLIRNAYLTCIFGTRGKL